MAMASMEDQLKVAVIGAGFLGARIISEMLLLGNQVAVYDSRLSKAKNPQETLNETIAEALGECNELKLLHLACMSPPEKSLWKPLPDQKQRQAQACSSIAQAAKHAHLVIEAVPDRLDIKCKVFAEALQEARPGCLLATNTLSLSLKSIQEAVRYELGGVKLPASLKPRVVGLRFLSPVVFIPFVEVTLTAEQEKGPDKEDLLQMLSKWGKNCFICDIEGSVEADERSSIRLARERLRLDTQTAQRRQTTEAELRGLLQQGKVPAAVVEDFREPTCCICYEAEPSVQSMICGHKALCNTCASVVESGTKQCPLCRERFVRPWDVSVSL